MKPIRFIFSPAAVVGFAAAMFAIGVSQGIKLEKKFYEDRFAKRDAWEQFKDILEDALNGENDEDY